LEQCSVDIRSGLRYSSMLAWIQRQVRDRLSSVLRSMWAAIDMMILDYLVSRRLLFPLCIGGR
jgi:hypothetical protein